MQPLRQSVTNYRLTLEVPEDYIIFDCPGQVELFTHHASLRNIFFRLQKLGYRVCSHLDAVSRASCFDRS